MKNLGTGYRLTDMAYDVLNRDLDWEEIKEYTGSEDTADYFTALEGLNPQLSPIITKEMIKTYLQDPENDGMWGFVEGGIDATVDHFISEFKNYDLII